MRVVVGERYYLALHPRPAYIIGSGRVGEEANLMAASWVSPVSEEPPRVMLAVDKESYTWSLIEKYGVFSINVVDEGYVDKIYYVGSRSGREVDKVSTSGLKVVPGEDTGTPVLEEAICVIECRVFKTIDCGDTMLVVGDVARCVVDGEKFNARYGWDLRKVSIPLHLWGRAFTAPRGVRFAKT
jgi:flavin reductase (DIM6/NTAB) family NADH-FMN oxidoreductase RutF